MNASINLRLFALLIIATVFALSCSQAPSESPNVLWITSEDNGPHLGAYGDDYADTPNLDALAQKGIIYDHAWSTAPVCAPARTTIISGMYPASTGSQHMRSMTNLPEGMKMYPQYLREAGYYTSNNSKEDYNLAKPGQVWDDSSRTAHFRNRADGQPFFSIFNFTTTHESQIRKRPHTQVHDPAKVTIPAYHPDTPEVRQDWAQYHDKMTEMDAQAGEILAQLEEDGLAEDTIVLYYGDHGPGIARSKRYPYDSGLRVPLIVYVPEKYKDLAPKDYTPGGSSDRLVGFIDLAPTLLSTVGIEPPANMQGHAFMGPYDTPPQPIAFGFRGRMDERIDMMRVARDERYIYIRNYKPHKVYGQYVQYLFQTPTTQVWHKLYAEGKLEPPQTYFWETKPFEELYDLQEDPDETKNLIDAAELQPVADKLRKALDEHLLKIRDLGFLPEYEIHARSKGSTPHQMGADPAQFPMEEIKAAADLAASMKAGTEADLKQLFAHSDSAVRYWAALGFVMRGKEAVMANREALLPLLNDEAPAVQVAAAEALGRYGTNADAKKALDVLMSYADPEENGIFIAMAAMNAVDYMDERALPAKAKIAALSKVDPNVNARVQKYVGQLQTKTLMDLE
jgi:arylsulfatase A-like enzyme